MIQHTVIQNIDQNISEGKWYVHRPETTPDPGTGTGTEKVAWLPPSMDWNPHRCMGSA